MVKGGEFGNKDDTKHHFTYVKTTSRCKQMFFIIILILSCKIYLSTVKNEVSLFQPVMNNNIS